MGECVIVVDRIRDRWWRSAWLLAVIALVATEVAAAAPAELALGHARLSQGRYRLAAAAFQDVVAVQPDNGGARMGLARAWSAVNRCSDALSLLADLRAEGVWTARAAAAEGDCRWVGGDLMGAVAAYEEALWLDDRGAYGWMRLEAALRASGDVDGAIAARGALLTLAAGPLVVLTAETDQAVYEARPEADALLRELDSFSSLGGAVLARIARLEGRRWLDLGWPEQAEAVLMRALRFDLGDAELAAWHAEATRRTGDPAAAAAALERPAVATQEPTALVIAIRARILVDQGRLGEAAQVLGEVHDHPELLASRWYLARAEGKATAGWHQRWAHADLGAPRRQLTHLVPTGDRP